MSHTKGPWNSLPAKVVDSQLHAVPIIMAPTGKVTGVEFSPDVKSLEELEANALLMAAAPDMLQALEVVLRRSVREPDTSLHHVFLSTSQMKRIRTAIHKAKGGDGGKRNRR